MLLNNLISFSKKKPGKIAFVSENKTYTFEQALVRIQNIASFLRDKGCKKKNKIIIYAENSIEWIFLYFAIQYIQSIPIILGKYLPKKKINNILIENNIKFFISDKKMKSFLLRNVINITTDEIRKIEFESKKIENYKKTSNSYISEIIFTSGSTSEPKGVILTKKNSLFIAKQINNFVKVSNKDRELLLLPLSHSFGLGRLKSQLIAGNTMIVLKDLSNFGKLLLAIKKYKVTGFGAVPSIIEILKKIDSSYIKDIKKNIKFIELGSEEINHETINWLLKNFPNARVCHHYGMTEASRAIFIKYNKSNLKNNLIGKKSLYSKITIINNKKKVCKNNEIGEIVIKGPFVMKNYLSKTNDKKPFISQGFLTGDFGYKDKKGNYFLIGRKDSLVKINGINVSLIEIENCINKFPDIKDSLCELKKTNSRNKFINAKIVCRKKFKLINLINYMQKVIENYKIPKNFIIVKKLPPSKSNKLMRYVN